MALAAHLGSQLPILVRGIYYDQWQPDEVQAKTRSRGAFIETVASGLHGIKPIDPEDATTAVFRVIAHHIDPGQTRKVRSALPEELQLLWPSELSPGAARAARRTIG